jgi:hypothetical protein
MIPLSARLFSHWSILLNEETVHSQRLAFFLV